MSSSSLKRESCELRGVPVTSPVCRCWVGSEDTACPSLSLRLLLLEPILSGELMGWELVRELESFLLFGASCSLNSSLALDFPFTTFWDLSSLTTGDAFEELLLSVRDDLDSFRPRSLAGEDSYSDEDGWRDFSWKAMCGVEDCESAFLSDAAVGFERLK